MIFPALTAFYGALIGLVFAVLSVWVIVGRGQYNVLHSDGGSEPLARRIRAHGNFAEYVPFVLLLIGAYEGAGGGHGTIRALLVILLAARIAHPIGMIAPENSVEQYAFRATGALATLGVLIAASVLLLLKL